MARIYPFRALRPAREHAASVASVPYDVVSRDEAKALAGDEPRSYLHVTRPEIDLPEDVDPHSDEVYAQGRASLERLIAEGTLVREAQPALYVYELTMASHVQRGVVLLASVEDYDQNLVRKHEYTRPDKEDDRVRHMEILRAQSGTVFLCHRDAQAIDGVVDRIAAGDAEVDFTATDGVRHRVWSVRDTTDIEAVVKGFELAGPIYIADGHHRSAAASRVSAGKTGEAYRGFLAVSFPASQMQILPYNRHVLDLNGGSAAALLEKLRATLTVTPGKPEASAPAQFGMYLDGEWHTVRVPESKIDRADPVARLDVSLLQDLVLGPVLGVDDPRTSERIVFVGGIRGDQELVKRVDQQGGVAFSMHATPIEELFAIADAEEVMPPKSTWFEPKLRDGLFTHVLED